ncbi:MAG: hypothetical protein PHR35_12730, partial [Kiritimatiellae bacterium]|nr:hypothetical protein [Kiritimatiellia bacterium]
MKKKPTDVRVTGAALHFLPVTLRLPLKFGHETVTHILCARVRLSVEDRAGRRAEGWGETPLSAAWVWPSKLPYGQREDVLREFCVKLADVWPRQPAQGHPMEIGHAFIGAQLEPLWRAFNAARGDDPMPWLGALVCDSAFDIALHDAYGQLHGLPVYDTYNARYMNADLSAYLTPADGAAGSFAGKYPADYFVTPAARLSAWHLVGGQDLLEASDLTGREPDDGYPVVLRDWIRRDGLKCLKIKLRGNDAAWDYARIARVGRVAIEEGVDWLTTDFNCTVSDPSYVNGILDRLLAEEPRVYGMLLYVEQPFPYDLEANRIDVHSLSARKPL